MGIIIDNENHFAKSIYCDRKKEVDTKQSTIKQSIVYIIIFHLRD